MHLDFNDENWNNGNSGFGYADGDDNTYIAAGTLAVYLRKSFTIENVNEINSLVLDVDYDDGFVAYINGVEVARANINGTPPVYNSTPMFLGFSDLGDQSSSYHVKKITYDMPRKKRIAHALFSYLPKQRI